MFIPLSQHWLDFTFLTFKIKAFTLFLDDLVILFFATFLLCMRFSVMLLCVCKIFEHYTKKVAGVQQQGKSNVYMYFLFLVKGIICLYLLTLKDFLHNVMYDYCNNNNIFKIATIQLLFVLVHALPPYMLAQV